MKVSPKKENWDDYSARLNIQRVPRILYVAFTRPKPAAQKAVYLYKEMTAYNRLKKTSAAKALALVTQENYKLGTKTGQFDDIWNLYTAAKRSKGNIIWEFGPGWTTIGLVAGLIDGGKEGMVYAIEANEEWFEWYQKIFDKLDDEIKSRLTLIHSPTEPTDQYDEKSVRHTVLPDELPDLIHIDGCNNKEGIGVACDILDIADNLSNECTVIFDGRIHNLKFIQRNLNKPNKVQKKLLQRRLAQPILIISK